MRDFVLKFNLFFSLCLLIYSVSACAGLLQLKYQVVDEPLKPYVSEYNGLLNSHCYEGPHKDLHRYVIEIQEVLDSETWIGVCTRMANGFHIEIRKDWWDRADEDQRRQLMYHELAHCLIDRDHDSYPGHYMYFQFNEIPRDIYTAQAIQDIKNYCPERK